MAAICGIYKITEKKTEKSYIGQSKDIYKRLQQHQVAFDREKDDWHNIFHEHPEEFSFEILEVCEEEKLNERECYYINQYNTFLNGFNKTPGNYKTAKKTDSINSSKKINMLYTPLFPNSDNERRFYNAVTSTSFQELIKKFFYGYYDFYVEEGFRNLETGKCESIFIVPWKNGEGYGNSDFIYLSFSNKEPILTEELSKRLSHFAQWNALTLSKKFYCFYNNFGYKCPFIWRTTEAGEVKEFRI